MAFQIFFISAGPGLFPSAYIKAALKQENERGGGRGVGGG